MALASAGTSPATRSSSAARSLARRQAGSVGRSSSAESTPSARCSARATTWMIRLATARPPMTLRVSGSEGPAEAVEGLTLLRSQLGNERRGVRRPIAGGTPRQAQRGGATHQPLEGTIGVGARHARSMSNRVASGRPEPEQRGVRLGLSGREPERREIDVAGHLRSSDYYYVNVLPPARGTLDDLDGNPYQSGDEPEPEGRVRLPLSRALPRSLEREVVRREGVCCLGHGAQALRAPDPLLVALVEQPRQHPAGARDLAHETESRQELDPVERERDVGDMALGIRTQRVTEDLEYRLEQLLAREDEERPSRRGRREILPQALDEAGPLSLHGRQKCEHLHGEDGRGASMRIEHRLPLGLLEGVRRELAAQVLGDVAGDGMRRAAHPRIVAVPAARQRAGRSLAPHAARPAPQPGIRLGNLLELD